MIGIIGMTCLSSCSSNYCYGVQAEMKILKGPHEDLESYLGSIGQLRNIIKFFSSQKGFKSSEVVLNHANNLLAKAISKLEDEFRQLLSSYRFLFFFFFGRILHTCILLELKFLIFVGGNSANLWSLSAFSIACQNRCNHLQTLLVIIMIQMERIPPQITMLHIMIIVWRLLSSHLPLSYLLVFYHCYTSYRSRWFKLVINSKF